MLPAQFDAVKKHGRRARAGEVAVVALRTPGPRRLGIVAARRAGNAVQRNRLKRVIREFFRLQPQLFPEGDSVVIPGADAGLLNNGEVRERLAQALVKLRGRRSGEA